jgi:phenylalanyl-tRNA synthetase beta chain
MEYSLENLNKNFDLKNLTLTEFVNTLNLTGLEVDEINIEKNKNNKHFENIKITLKIPANREDLLNEELLLKEFKSLFLVNSYDKWEKLKINYSFLLKQKYLQYLNFKTLIIPSQVSSLINYSIAVKNFQNHSSPFWIEEKLKNSGIKIGSPLENLLNLNVLEWGQNINLIESSENFEKCNFEMIRLQKPLIFNDNVGKSYELKVGTIALKLNNKIVSVLGITNIISKKELNYFILEGSFYDIHENDLQLTDINSKLSLRYLRRMFLEKFKFSFQRLLTLIELTTNCEIQPIKFILNPKKYNLETYKILELKKIFLKNFLNIDIYDPLIFQKAGLKIVCETKNTLYFRIPLIRKDLLRPIDLIEEYSRFLGYKNFPEIVPKKSLCYSKKISRNKEFIKRYFLNYSFNEVCSNSIIDDFEINENSIYLNNPLNKELSVLRPNIIGNLIKIIEKNIQFSTKNFKFFEIGRTFKFNNLKYVEEDFVGGIFQVDFSQNEDLEWFIAKGFIENFLSNFQYEDLNFENLSIGYSQYYHSSRSTIIKSDIKEIGFFGELNPQLTRSFNLKKKIYLFEFNLKYLENRQLKSSIITYKEYSKYPTIRKDISIQVEQLTNFYNLKNYIKKEAKYLKNIEFFDLYFNETSKKDISLGIRFVFQSFAETLTTEKIEEELERILFLLEKEFNIKLIK